MSGRTARVVGAGMAGLAGLALLVAAVVLLTRSDDTAPVRIVAPQPAAPTIAGPAGGIRVQVGGAVRLPGVYAMNEGDRVMDAIAAAGGVSPRADLSAINLARRVQDEARYYVPAVGETPPAEPAGVGTGSPGAGERGGSSGPASAIDLNTATAQELESLPGIGPVMAGRIIAHREANGPFASVDSVENVPGIGPKTLESIRPMVTVSGSR